MIEQIMYFALGVLMATLVALLVLPAVWHRAVRLTTRRVEAAVPVSLFEVQADKDQQRAFFALNQRRLELQADAMRETIVAHASTIERHRLKVVELEQAKAALEDTTRRLEGLNAEQAVVVGELQDQVADRTAAAARLDEELGLRLAELAQASEAAGRLRMELDQLAAALAAREESLAAEQARAARLQMALEQLETAGGPDAALRATLAELAAKVVVLTAQVEGASSPIPALVAEAPAGEATLAGRIRALLHEAPQAAE
ncbi:hypothetical protein V5F53_16935 [Xanthobacter sp. V4C-4]|uniref:hypothetical protein n=1 Tax=Xanthobacter cornucopiae TaxID=3119924 RepID=UPI0037269AD3